MWESNRVTEVTEVTDVSRSGVGAIMILVSLKRWVQTARIALGSFRSSGIGEMRFNKEP